MVEQIVYNITMVTLSIFWVATSYLGAKCDDEDSKNIFVVQQTLFQTMCLVALIGHDLFLK